MTSRALGAPSIAILALLSSAAAAQQDSNTASSRTFPPHPLRVETVGPDLGVPIQVGAAGIASAGYSLRHSADLALLGNIFKDGFVFLHTEGGDYNTALGTFALASVTTGAQNTSVGAGALASMDTANGNSALGFLAQNQLQGSSNTAVGSGSLQGYDQNAIGNMNAALGFGALRSLSMGDRNIAIGTSTGAALQYGSDNVLIQNLGASTESNTLRIGSGTGNGYGQLERAFVSGIRNATGTFTTQVCVDGNDQLGPCLLETSNSGVPLELSELGDDLLRLRPLRFRVSRDVGGEEWTMDHVGLSAEEVAGAFPSLATYDDEGRPRGVRHDLFTPLLLAELQKQAAELRTTRERLQEQSELLREMRERLLRLEVREGSAWIPTSTGGS